MNGFGRAMRTLAIVIFIGLFICAIVDFAIGMDEIAETRSDYQDKFSDHRREIAVWESHDEDDCKTCRIEENLNQEAGLVFMGLVESTMMALFYSGALIALGKLGSIKETNKSSVEEQPLPSYQPQPQPQEPAVPTCPSCGNVVGAGQRFCNKCGTQVQG